MKYVEKSVSCLHCCHLLELNGLAIERQDTGKVLCESCIKTAFRAYEKKVLNKL